jgi:diguanylate cyclase (GGDEF)-like protein/PAS domain S-box-containing protein
LPVVVLLGVCAGTAIGANFVSPTAGALMRAFDGMLAVVALTVGALRNGARPTWAWSLLAAGIGVWVAGDALWDLLTIQHAADDSMGYTLADGLYLVMYPAVFAAILGLVGGGLRGSFNNVVDSVVLAVAAVLMIRLFAVDGTPVDSLDSLFNAAFPIGDALLLGGVAWLLFQTGSRNPAAWLLTSGVALMLVTDVAWDLESRYGTAVLHVWAGPAYPIAYGLVAAAAVHPSACRLSAHARPEQLRPHRNRLVLLCTSLGVLSLVALRDRHADLLLQVCVVALVSAVALRFATLVRAVERAYRQADRSERRFRQLATTVPVGILEADAGPQSAPHIVFANAESEQQFGRSLLGYETERLLELVADPVDENDASASRESVRRVLLGERESAQVRIRTGTGRERWVAWYGMPSGEHGAFVATVDITALKEAQSLLSMQASHDVLTSLPNRRLLYDRLGRALARLGRTPGVVAVLYLDLDGFKPVNDQLGHDAGDRLLQFIAGRLQTSVRAEDTVARVGGDEFVLVLDGIRSRADVAGIATKILNLVSAPTEVAGTKVSVGASIGIALGVAPDDDPELLMRQADAAMYVAKRAKGAQYCFATDLPALDRADPRNLTDLVPRPART